jgi:hypothetical protein
VALLLTVAYPAGERAIATGYVGVPLRVDIIPRGPEACYRDEVEVDFSGGEPYPVLRILSGPRRTTIRVRLPRSDEIARELWMDARAPEGWYARAADDGSDEIWIVAERDGLDVAALERAGASVVPGGG